LLLLLLLLLVLHLFLFAGMGRRFVLGQQLPEGRCGAALRHAPRLPVRWMEDAKWLHFSDTLDSINQMLGSSKLSRHLKTLVDETTSVTGGSSAKTGRSTGNGGAEHTHRTTAGPGQRSSSDPC